jgi:hypothetical protein
MTRKSKIWFAIAALIFIGSSAALRTIQYSFYRGVLPAALETSALVEVGSEPGIVMSLLESIVLPIRVESCGAAAFQLSPQTRDEIQGEKLAFFKTLTTSRSLRAGSRPRTYESWQESPLPREWLSVDAGGLWDGISCAHFGESLRERLRRSALQPGAYFSRINNQASVVVLPDELLIVYSWWD